MARPIAYARPLPAAALLLDGGGDRRHPRQPLVIALSETYTKVVEISSDPDNRGRFPTVQRPRYDSGMDLWCLAARECRGDAPRSRLEDDAQVAQLRSPIRERPPLPEAVPRVARRLLEQ